MTTPLNESTPYPSPSDTQNTRGATCAPTAPSGYSSSSGEVAEILREILREILPGVLPTLVASESASASASASAAAAAAAAARRMLAATTSALSSAVCPSLRSLHPANLIASPAAKIRMGCGGVATS